MYNLYTHRKIISTVYIVTGRFVCFLIPEASAIRRLESACADLDDL